MEPSVVFEKVGIALGLGLLVGLQRERVHTALAGIRTFALITVWGTLGALLAQNFGGWVVGLGAVAVAGLLVVGNLAKLRMGAVDPGLTTEFAALLMYGVGTYLVVGHTSVAIAVGGGVALLLHFKAPMHEFVARIGESDLRAIMQFVLIALVILPVLPDRTYDPYHVLNPHDVWLMVVLIVAISLGGYVAYKMVGRDVGAVLGGVLGGLISSTATTVSYARRTYMAPDGVSLGVLVIVIASTVALARVLTEIAVVAPNSFRDLGPPLATMLGLMVLVSCAVYPYHRGNKSELPEQENPAELKPALLFGGLYAVVILGVAAAKDYFGETGLYGVALLSGLHDMDAITLSTARLVDQGQIHPSVGWRLILAASLSNLVAKAAIVAVLGHRRLLGRIAIPYGVAFLGGFALLFLWPE